MLQRTQSLLGRALRRFASPRTISALGPPEDELQAKASRTGPLLAFETLRQPVWSPRDYVAFAREGFMQNAIVYRSVRMVAEAAASVPLLLFAGEHELTDHPLLSLFARPNPICSTPDLLESWYGFLLVSGNAYLEAVAVDGTLRELYALRPDRMKVVPGPNGWPEAFDYGADGRTVRFAGEVVPGVSPILHVKLFNPVNDYYGMSPIEAAAGAIAGTRRCSTTRRGPPAPSSIPPATATSRPNSTTASRPSWSRASRAPPVPAGRCCSKAGSTGSP
jgi:phage portal protein BeeE